MSVLSVRSVRYIWGLLLLAFSFFLLIPMAVDLIDFTPAWKAFGISFLISLGFSLTLLISSWGERLIFGFKEGFFLTAASWLSISLIAALPYILLSHFDGHLTFADAFFESVSGLTTTGASVYSDLSVLSHGTLLWRAITQWLGGVGLVVMATALLPMLHIGGMQVFQLESFDITDKVVSSERELSWLIMILYLLFTFLIAAGYSASGMSSFDALIHAMTTISTGGFGTRNDSFGSFGMRAEIVAIIGMLVGASHFVLFLYLFKGMFRKFFLDEQQVGLMIVTVGATLTVLALGIQARIETPEGTALSRLVKIIFSITSVMTTTGFVDGNYEYWGTFATVFFFFLTFVGGCTGSTAGGIKIYRFQLAYKVIKKYFRLLEKPHALPVMKFNQVTLDEFVIIGIVTMIFLYILTWMGATFYLAVAGEDFITALSASATAVNNVGPGLGSVVGPSSNFSLLRGDEKIVLSLTMLLGRLDMIPILIILRPSFWRFS